MSAVSKIYTADGSTKIYLSDFKVLSESHIQVYFGSEAEATIVSKRANAYIK